jgi:hypothetical protein
LAALGTETRSAFAEYLRVENYAAPRRKIAVFPQETALVS